MEPLLERGWDAVREGVERAERVLLATDFDGTLAPIVPRPELAAMSDANRSSLRSLSESERFLVAVVTGRTMEEIRRLVTLDGVYYAATYGMEIDGPRSFRFREPRGDRARSAVASLAPELDRALSGIAGAVVENKALSITVHHRHVGPADLGTLRYRVSEVTGPAVALGLVEVHEGHRSAIEVLPVGAVHKGDAVALILDHACETGVQPWPIYLGDDVMDEDGFRTANERGGVSVVVGPEADAESDARYCAESPAEVTVFLERLARTVAERT